MNSIEIKNVSMVFRLYHEKAFTLKERVINLIKGKNTYENFHAIRDMDLEVKQGEVLGIIGENGSGKSTLLKLICRVLRPGVGDVSVNGNISPLLELGAGFDPELTGRENIYLNGSLMGFTKKEMDKKFDNILRFAELENFIDTPVKNYSSGMYMRLGFSIAIDVDPDILIIDEILAVGDVSFQKKCINKINEFKAQGKTIILVSHDLPFIRSFCSVTLWLNGGKKAALGPTDEVIEKYLSCLAEKEKKKLEANQING